MRVSFWSLVSVGADTNGFNLTHCSKIYSLKLTNTAVALISVCISMHEFSVTLVRVFP